MILEFQSDHIYKYMGKRHMPSWNRVMDVVLDHKPRKCVSSGYEDCAAFSDVGDGKHAFGWYSGFELWIEIFGEMEISENDNYSIKE